MVAIAHHLASHRARCAALQELLRQTAIHAEDHFRDRDVEHFDRVVNAAKALGAVAESYEDAADVPEAEVVAFGISLIAEIGSIACSLAWAGYEMKET